MGEIDEQMGGIAEQIGEIAATGEVQLLTTLGRK
jgi:hypothetical protein